MRSVLLATCAALPDGDEDAASLDAALARLDVQARWAAWTDPHVDWDEALVVLRSTWDYTADRDAFVEWVGRLPRVANAGAVVAWNTDKVYLRDLAAAGVPIVATTFAAPGEQVVLPTAGDDASSGGDTRSFAFGECVIKPSVGAGSRGAGRFTPDRAHAALRHAGSLHDAGRVVLVQPYLAGVDTVGETSLIYVDGCFSHAIRKGPMLPEGVAHPVHGWELYVDERIEARSPSPAELEVGRAALTAVRDRFGADQLYARIDLLPGLDGPVVVELELTEPSLFLLHAPDGEVGSSVDRFAAAIAARA